MEGGADSRNRTDDLSLTRRMLWPAELCRQNGAEERIRTSGVGLAHQVEKRPHSVSRLHHQLWILSGIPTGLLPHGCLKCGGFIALELATLAGTDLFQKLPSTLAQPIEAVVFQLMVHFLKITRTTFSVGGCVRNVLHDESLMAITDESASPLGGFWLRFSFEHCGTNHACREPGPPCESAHRAHRPRHPSPGTNDWLGCHRNNTILEPWVLHCHSLPGSWHSLH
jgi:hypothetical protein